MWMSHGMSYARYERMNPSMDQLSECTCPFSMLISLSFYLSMLCDILRPLEVIGHDGIARNVTMEPGDLVLYESHSVIHGRQFPLKGRFVANVFIHFEPVGPLGGPIEYNGDLPPYLLPGSPEEPVWRQRNPKGHVLTGRSFTTGSNDAHLFASSGDIASLEKYLNDHPQSIHQTDKNGWTPLVEAVRAGRVELVRLLLDRGSHVNVRAGPEERGGSVLWLAKYFHGRDHPIVNLLMERGATVDAAPEAHQHSEL